MKRMQWQDASGNSAYRSSSILLLVGYTSPFSLRTISNQQKEVLTLLFFFSVLGNQKLHVEMVEHQMVTE